MSKLLEFKIIRSDGSVLNCDEDWGVLSLEGIGAADVEVFKDDKGFGNGSIVTGKRAADREIVINCKARPGIYSVQESRRRIVGFFSIEYTYNIEITLYGQSRKTPVPCELISIDIETPSRLQIQRAEWTATLLCPEPYFQATESNTKDISDSIQTMGFPMMFDGSTDYCLAYFKTGELKTIYYNGTAPAPITLDLVATAAAESMEIILTRGDKEQVIFRIDKSLSVGDEIIIDVRNSELTLNGSILDPESYIETVGALADLMLTYGDNSFIFRNENKEKTFDGSITYSAEYNGV